MLGAISQNGGKDIGQCRPLVQGNQSGGEVRNRKEGVTGGRGDKNAGHRVMRGTGGERYCFVAWTRECGDTRCQAGGRDVIAIMREHGYIRGRDAGEDCFPEQLAGIRTHHKQKKTLSIID